MNDASRKRHKLRPQLLSGKSKNTHWGGGEPLGQDWLKQKWPECLDAHFACRKPEESAVLGDVFDMMKTGKAQITCPGSKKEEEEEPRTLSEGEILVVKEWYDKKDKDLEESRGQYYFAYPPNKRSL